MKKLYLLFLFMLTAIILTSCKEDIKAEMNPKIAILGKWEITHLGNGSELIPIDNPSAYEEYLPDSILQSYNYEEKTFDKYKFWLNDSLLIKSFTYIDQIDKDTIVFTLPYKYEFITPNKLKLDFEYPAIFGTSIYKRIK